MIIKEFFANHWPKYALGIFFLIVTDLLSLLIPRAIGQAVDSIGLGNGQVNRMIILIGGVALVMAILRYLYRECIMGTTRRLEHHLRSKIFRHSLFVPMSAYDESGPGKIMALAVNDVTSVRVAVGLGIMLLVDAGIMGLASFVVMFRSIDPMLTLLSVAPLPFVFVGTAWLGRIVHTRYKKVQEQFSELTEFAQELFGGVKVVKAFGAERQFVERFAAVNRSNMNANLSLAGIQAIYTPVTHVAPLFCYAIALFTGGRMIIAGNLTVGELTAFTGYLGLIIWPVMGLSYLINTVQRGMASKQRIDDFLAISGFENIVESGVASTAKISGAIELHNLTFQYPNAATPSLLDVSAIIPADATVGIVGRTGSGKTTLLRLLLRLYPVDDGMIFVDGEDLNRYEFAALRAAIGYVPQEAALFSLTIAENIAFGEDYDRLQIQQAARISVVEADIDARAEGFATLLGEKGVRLSGGQPQRVAIARALIRNPSILLLDDVFASLDYKTQNQLVENLRELETGRTTLIISQRVAAVKHASFILVLDAGRICEQGTHDQLLLDKGLYFKLYEQQLAAGETL
jgi:ATP-binding cassette subfamily B protein